MNFLGKRRSQLVLICFLLTASVFVLYPGIDIRVSSLFFDDGFPAAQARWTRLLHHGLSYVLATCMATVLVVYALNRLRARNTLGINGRTVVYLLIVLVVGAGLIVNVAFKDHFGRARPRDIVEFGGTLKFTPAFVFSDQCRKNCSFSSGEAAGGFFALALARALSRRRAATVAAFAFGSVVSLARLASGAHFLSDIVISFFVMLIVSEVAYHFLLDDSPKA